MLSQQHSGLEALLNRPRPSVWEQFLRAPCCFIARRLYALRTIVPPERRPDAISVVCISDTHNSQPELPDGDILVHAGDLTQSGSVGELQAALAWLRSQPHAHKLVVAGNHDQLLDAARDNNAAEGGSARAQLDWTGITYLQDESTTIKCANGRFLRVYGSPRSPKHGNWAFQYPRAQDIWAGVVPTNTDILITHGPPRGHLDLATLGCVHLLRELWRARPALHVFGHVHEGAGLEWVVFDELQDAYERTMIAGGGVWNLLGALREFVRASFMPTTISVQPRTLLVNASVVGGLRDEERRRPVKVYI